MIRDGFFELPITPFAGGKMQIYSYKSIQVELTVLVLLGSIV